MSRWFHARARFGPLGYGLLACLAAGAALSCGTGGDGPPPTGQDRPFRDEWRLEFSVPFPYDPEAEDPGIERLQLGEGYPNLGVHNRGDVIVVFDAPDQTIELELRRFSYAGSQEAAQDNFELIGIIAEDPEGNDCTKRWWDRCVATLDYAGQTQPLRDGADMRVHLPANYHHHIEIEAHDVSEDVDYPDRGDVCIEAFAGEATITLDSGAAFVTLSDVTSPAPDCTPDALAACEDAGWDESCGCQTGSLRVDTRELQRADVTVDMPIGLWSTIDLTNVDTAGEICALDIDLPDVELSIDTQQRVKGEVARPETAASGSIGYAVTARSLQCGEVPFVTGPSDFADVQTDLRGDLRVCSGCIGGRSCEELLEGE